MTLKAAGIDHEAMTPGELKVTAEWLTASGRAPLFPAIG